jgi:hypothetical protein
MNHGNHGSLQKIDWLIPGMTPSLKKKIAQVMVILDEGR